MRRKYHSLPARTRWELILSIVLSIGILGALAVPSGRGKNRAVREKASLFQLVQSDFLEPAFASARDILRLNSGADRILGFGGYDEFQSCVRLPRGNLVANLTRYSGQTLSLLGGKFLLREDRALKGPRLFISEEFWQRAFDRDPAAVGATIVVNGYARRVAGVFKNSRGFLSHTEIWIPVCSRGPLGAEMSLRVFGALRADADWKGAQKELALKFGTRWTAPFTLLAATPKIVPVERGVYFGEQEETLSAATERHPRSIEYGSAEDRG